MGGSEGSDGECWRITMKVSEKFDVRLWLNYNAMIVYQTFICFCLNEVKHLC